MLQVRGNLRVQAIVRMAVFVGWLLAFAVAGRACAADSEANNESASVDQAQAMLKEGADWREVVAMLEPLGYGGNGRAQLILGALYLEGNSEPRDVVQGYAWLEFAATAADPAIAKHAKSMLLASAAGLSGGELIRAEQRAAEIRSTMAERSYERYGAGLRQFTTERPVRFFPWIKFEAEPIQLTPIAAAQSNPNVRLGCAAAANSVCPSKSRAVVAKGCTGRIMHVDSGPSSSPSAETYIVLPEIPVKLRRRGSQSSTKIVIHVDSSGWICAAAIAESSAEPSWDTEALRAVTSWRLRPAMLRGEAVESLLLSTLSAKGAR